MKCQWDQKQRAEVLKKYFYYVYFMAQRLTKSIDIHLKYQLQNITNEKTKIDITSTGMYSQRAYPLKSPIKLNLNYVK